MNKGAIHFFNKLKDKHYTPKNICEIGVYLPEESNIIGFIHQGIATTLVEADPNYITRINQYFKDQTNITVVEAAVFDFHGEVELCRRESSTFISRLESSPALINDKFSISEADTFTANCIRFSEIDNGKFDLISIDIEGAEWYVIKHMISRPDIISVETHGKYYTNPNIKEINGWMNNNGYVKWYKNDSDTVFVKKGVFGITASEKWQLVLKNIEIGLIKLKKPFTLLKAKKHPALN